jgi:hypothetical protein
VDRATPYEPDGDEILVHRYDDADQCDAYFFVGTNYGHGQPHYFVTLDENGGERSWWLDPESATSLGERLIRLAADCRRLDQKHELRDQAADE